MTDTADDPKDMVANRLTVVPAFSLFTFQKGSQRVDGRRLGARVNAITCSPVETDTEPSTGVWSAGGAELNALLNHPERTLVRGVWDSARVVILRPW